MSQGGAVARARPAMNDPAVIEALGRGNPVVRLSGVPFRARRLGTDRPRQVFFDITIGGVPSGRIKIELFADETPKTAE